MRNTPAEWPWAVSTMIISALAATSASRRSYISLDTPTAAPTNKRPLASFAELGYFVAFSISLIVISPFKLPSLSTNGNFSMRCSLKIAFASSRDVPSGAVTRESFVMQSPIWRVKSVSKRISRFVMIPTSLPCSVIGTPEILYLRINSSASERRF